MATWTSRSCPAACRPPAGDQTWRDKNVSFFKIWSLTTFDSFDSKYYKIFFVSKKNLELRIIIYNIYNKAVFLVCFKIFDGDRDGLLSRAETNFMINVMLQISENTDHKLTKSKTG